MGFIVYAAKTVEQAKRLALMRLQRVRRIFNLKWTFNLAENTIRTQNNIIVFAGLKDLSSAERLQGLPLKLVIIDESPFIKGNILEFFVRDIVAGGMFDFKGKAQCCFVGNPFPVHHGFLWDQIQNPEASHHEIHFMDNPEFTEKEKVDIIKKEMKSRGETMDKMSNSTKRVIFGQWAKDDGHLLLNFKEEDIFKLSDIDVHSLPCAMGVDLGYDDKTAIAICYYDVKNYKMYLAYEYQDKSLTLHPLALKIQSLLLSYKTNSQNVIDTQGGGKQIALSLSRDYGIPFHAARKSEKKDWLAIFRSFNRAGNFKVLKESALLHEANHIVFNEHFTDLDESVFHSDIFHACLYLFRYIYYKHFYPSNQAKPQELTPLQDLLKRIEERDLNQLPGRVKQSNYLL